MVEVRLAGGHPTAGEDTGVGDGFDLTSLTGGGSASGGADVDYLTVLVGDGGPPFRFLLLFCDLAGDVGDDRPPSGDLCRVVVESGQGGEIDPDIDDASGLGCLVRLPPVEEGEKDVGPDLVDAAGVVGGFGGSGEPVDLPHHRIGLGGGQVEA